MKKLTSILLALVMALTLCSTVWAEGVSWTTGEGNSASITVTTAEELKNVFSDLLDRNYTYQFSRVSITINAERLDFSGITDWRPLELDGIKGTASNGSVTIVGKDTGTTLYGMTGMLISDAANGIDLTVKNLTIDSGTMSASGDDVGCGAFLGMSGSGGTFLFENCKVTNTSITSEDYAGGFAGYIACDDASNQTVTFKNCEVSGCVISGGGSVGAIMGVGMSNGYSSLSVIDTNVKNNNITCTNSSTEKAGALFGTASTADCTSSVITVSAEVSGNTVTSGNQNITTIYGRGYASTLEIKGGSYDNPPLKQDETNFTVKVAEDVTGAEVTVNGATKYVYGADAIRDMAGIQGAQIKVTHGTLTIGNVEYNKDSGTINIPNEYTVTFIVDGGTPAPDAQTVTEGGKATKPTDPTKDGYTFKGWYSGDEEWNFDEKTVTESVTLTAKWEQVTSNNNHHFTVHPTTDTTPKAESPKTFDAGIAVYGVMAVSSVLGMGYMGKKKF